MIMESIAISVAFFIISTSANAIISLFEGRLMSNVDEKKNRFSH